jgi:hypothetical protein
MILLNTGGVYVRESGNGLLRDCLAPKKEFPNAVSIFAHHRGVNPL